MPDVVPLINNYMSVSSGHEHGYMKTQMDLNKPLIMLWTLNWQI